MVLFKTLRIPAGRESSSTGDHRDANRARIRFIKAGHPAGKLRSRPHDEGLELENGKEGVRASVSAPRDLYSPNTVA